MFAEFGIIPPSSAHGQEDPLVMISSSQERRMDIDSSDSIPSVGDASTEGSFALEDNPVGLGNANASEVFRAAQQLTHKDRLEAVEERKKNQDLVNFILTKGHSLQEVQSFLSGNGIQRSLNDQDLIVPPSSCVGAKDHDDGLKRVASSPARGSQSPPLMLPGSSRGLDCVGAGPSLDKVLEEGELPHHPSPKSLELGTEVGEMSHPKTWSSLLSQESPPQNLSLSFFPPQLPSSEQGNITIQPP